MGGVVPNIDGLELLFIIRPMSHVHSEEWSKNIKELVGQAKNECIRAIAETSPDGVNDRQHRANLLRIAHDQVKSLSIMFSNSHQPSQIKNLADLLTSYRSNLGNRNVFNNLLKAIDELSTIAHPTTHIISFHDVFESFKTNGELQDLFDQLVQTIEKIIVENQDNLNARIVRELETLLKSLQANQRSSSYELGAWAELSARFLMEIAEKLTGTPGLQLVVDGIKLAKKTYDTVAQSYHDSQRETVRLLQLRSAEESFTRNISPFDQSRLHRLGIDEDLDCPPTSSSSAETPHPPASEPAAPASGSASPPP